MKKRCTGFVNVPKRRHYSCTRKLACHCVYVETCQNHEQRPVDYCQSLSGRGDMICTRSWNMIEGLVMKKFRPSDDEVFGKNDICIWYQRMFQPSFYFLDKTYRTYHGDGQGHQRQTKFWMILKSDSIRKNMPPLQLINVMIFKSEPILNSLKNLSDTVLH